MSAILTPLQLPREHASNDLARAPISVGSWLLVSGLWIYALIVAAWMYFGWAGQAVVEVVGTWHALFSQTVALCLMVPLLRELKPGFRRVGWLLIFLAAITDLIGNLWWAYLHSDPIRVETGWNDVVYMAYYPLAAGAFAMFFRELGGSFRRRQVWLDIITLALALGATLWLFLLEPELQKNTGLDADIVKLIGVFAGDGVMLILMSLLVMQISEWKSERALLLLIAGTAASFTTDLGWVGSDATRQYLLEVWLHFGGYGMYYALLGTAAVLERQHRPQADIRFLEGNRYSFLPILAMLLAIGMLFGENVALQGAEGIALLAFVLVGAMLVVARQQGVRSEILRMQNVLTRREVQQHLTELIRRSEDLIVVADARGQATFVSPSAETLLGSTVEDLKSRPAARLFGVEHEARLQSFLDDIAQRQAVRADMELVVATADGERLTFQIVGSDQLGNAAIGGIALTISDVTARRRLEREVLEIAVLERDRLASDIRDGLGLELNRIRGLLVRLKGTPDNGLGSPVANVDGVIAQVNRTIDLARKLAVNLSPLHVARGSLELAIGRLVKEIAQRHALRIEFHHDIEHRDIDGSEADHLYRIAQEVLNYAARTVVCSQIEIDLHIEGEWLRLSIDARGGAPGVDAEAEMGMRMAEYRARVVGGVMRRERTSYGMRVEVSMPLLV